MTTQEEMFSYFERRSAAGVLVSKALKEIGDDVRTLVCFYAVKDLGADIRVVYLDGYVSAYAKQMAKKYREDPVEFARYRPATKHAVSLEFGL